MRFTKALLQQHASDVQNASPGAMLVGSYILDKDQSGSADDAKTLNKLWLCRYELDVEALKGALEREEAARAAEGTQHATTLAGVQGSLEQAEVGRCPQQVLRVPLHPLHNSCSVCSHLCSKHKMFSAATSVVHYCSWQLL